MVKVLDESYPKNTKEVGPWEKLNWFQMFLHDGACFRRKVKHTVSVDEMSRSWTEWDYN